MSLTKYAGPWTSKQSAHLLRRATFGPDNEIIEQSASLSLDETLDVLFQDMPLPAPPVKFQEDEDASTAIGETWVGKPYNFFASQSRQLSIAGWTIEQMYTNRTSVIEKMVMFWHNHFAVSDGNPDSRVLYKYISTLRENALGDFRQMTKDITIDPLMLRYLNGRENAVGAPNENYARELLELFTVGKGDIVGSGDYTTFTEVDVVEIAKVLTGWRDVGYKNPIVTTLEGQYRDGRHDKTTKTLSHRFGNVSISNEGSEEYKTLIDTIFQSEHVATFICRKLYRWFVYYDITEEVEQEVIQPLATIFRESDYNVKPVLRALLASEHFYDDDQYGCMIKSPLDFIMTLTNSYSTATPEVLAQKYYFNFIIFRYIADNQMSIYDLPSVAGWKPYYQSPGYYQIWINAVTLPIRKQASDALTFTRIFPIPQIDAAIPLGIDVIRQLENISDANDINKLIRETADIHLPKPLSESQYDLLKSTILQGLPDFEWSVEYNQYLADPQSEEKRIAIENKLKLFLITMMRMPEFQLM